MLYQEDYCHGNCKTHHLWLCKVYNYQPNVVTSSSKPNDSSNSGMQPLAMLLLCLSVLDITIADHGLEFVMMTVNNRRRGTFPYWKKERLMCRPARRRIKFANEWLQLESQICTVHMLTLHAFYLTHSVHQNDICSLSDFCSQQSVLSIRYQNPILTVSVWQVYSSHVINSMWCVCEQVNTFYDRCVCVMLEMHGKFIGKSCSNDVDKLATAATEKV